MIEPIKILGVPVHPMTMVEAVDSLEQRMLAGEQTFVVTANAEIIMMCQEDASYDDIISHKAELVLPDGAGAVWAGRHLGYNVPERVAGFDLYNQLLALSAKKGYEAYFLAAHRVLRRQPRSRARSFIPACKLWVVTMAILLMPMFLVSSKRLIIPAQRCCLWLLVHPSRRSGFWSIGRSLSPAF